MWCTVVIEEGHQHLKDYHIEQSSNVRLFGVQRKRETPKLLQFLELIRAMYGRGGNTRQRSASAKQHKFTGLKKLRFSKIDDAIFTVLIPRCKIGINCILFFLQTVQQIYHFSKIKLSTMNFICI
jgi:hypothetical protein